MEEKTNSDLESRDSCNIIGSLPSLPQEIIEEILKRLPVKSLNRFRCVSKSWLSIILNPEFIKKHFNHSANNPRVMYTLAIYYLVPEYELKHSSFNSLFLEHETVASDIDYPMKHLYTKVQVVGSCNGIICLAMDKTDIFLWNPSMRTSKKLPPLSAKSDSEWGFGFDKCGGDYKVVAIRCTSNELKAHIYSTKADSWKKIKDVRPGFFMWDYLGKYASRKFHFMIRPALYSENMIIISVDSRNGMFGVVEEPDYGVRVIENNLGVLGGCICVFSNNWAMGCDVWVMKEYNVKESWTKLFSFPYYEVPKWGCKLAPLYSGPLVMLPNGEVLVVCGKHFVVYNPKDESFRCPQITNVPDGFTKAIVHVESLVTL